eukprot:TRINITY_DN3237_c0_g4_i2.p1 TRINITY_DN3237_c0_g4~~TRINITY_DN3237_c0_g4_i2.p1  ORF type:complete len:360 (-),score=75.67 TRINITY_DN3237_c0_g4_i2:100-1179(-)
MDKWMRKRRRAKLAKSFMPSLGKTNTEALRYIDSAISAAQKLGLKLIIPLTDNYHYYHGGKYDFTNWRGVPEAQFYYNPTVIADFKNYISLLLTHKNVYNGMVMVDDPTILAWETGNELQAPSNWTQQIADYIKTIDRNHLVIDGNYGINPTSLPLASVDIYSDHYYPMDVNKLKSDAQQVALVKKVFIAGEYGWASTQGSSLQSFVQAIESSTTNGDLFWSLFGHLDSYGFEQHDDGYTLHYPGDTVAMENSSQVLRKHAYTMRGIPTPAQSNIPAPLITTLFSGTIAWRGAAGAANYTIESSPSNSGPWTTICDKCATDNDTPISSQYIIKNLWYRVKGTNFDGVAGPYSPLEQCAN